MISPAALFWVFIGGGLGSVLRFTISKILIAKPGLESNVLPGFLHGIPAATLLVNVLGSFVIGIFAAIVSRETIGGFAINQAIFHPFLIAGLLGGFTTFSAFSLETVLLLQSGKALSATIYIMASVVFSLFAAYLGYILAK